MDVIFKVFYRLPPDRVAYVYRNVQDFRERLGSIAVDRLKAEMGKVNVAHVAEKRGELRDRIRDVLIRDGERLGVLVTDFQLTNLDYTKSFKAAVEQAASAKAMVETREQELNQARKVAESTEVRAKGEAAATRERARGEADGRLLIAMAEAKAIELRGEAEAKAIKAQTEALAANGLLVELRKAEKWNGSLPTAMLSNVVPFMGVDQLGIRK